jgi:mRNA interferase RelE/StbE
MTWKIIFTKRAEKDFKSLSQEVKKIITKAINLRLLPNPDLALIPLTGKLKGIYKFRVGSYRILCEKRSKELVIIVVKVSDRKEVYKFNQ